ncbi:MAG TPA: tape measure protein, partial [Prosthecobacter sp.]|nr:tape measure protein [Prosthecobacter sp.]
MAAIEASLRLEIAQYQAAMARARGEIDRLKARAKSGGAGLSKDLFGGVMRGAAALGVTLGTARIASGIFDSVVAMESLEKMLRTTEGSAEAATQRMAELREVARLPGVGFEQAVRADVRLRSIGLTADDSKNAIIEFGNALALVGGTRQDLDGVVLALGQISAKGKVSAEEINQIAERIPQVRAVMRAVFGTADTEAIQAMKLEANDFIRLLVAGLAELQRAQKGLQDELADISTMGMEMANDIGGELVRTLIPAFQDVLSVIAANREGLQSFGAVAADVFSAVADILEATSIIGYAGAASIIGGENFFDAHRARAEEVRRANERAAPAPAA